MKKKKMNSPSHDINKTIGRNIAMIRRVSGVKQKELADYLGVSTQQISKYEKGVSTISADKIVILSRFFKIDSQIFLMQENIEECILKTIFDDEKI